MADSIFSVLCSVALKYVGAEGVDQIVGLFREHLSDQGQRVIKALRESNEKAWKALEIALAGETLWNRLDRAEDRAFRQQLAAYLKQLPLPELAGKEDYRKKVLQDIHRARNKALLFGRLIPEDLARRVGPMADRSNPQGMLAAERQALLDIAGELRKAELESLAWLLEQQPQPGQSVLVVSVRYYFQRAVEEEPELARRLQFTAMESLTESQQQGFRQLDEGLKAHAARVEAVMADLAEVAAEIRDLAGDLRGSALDLRSEMEKMRGEHRELYARVLQMLEQQEMHQRPVHGGDSLSIRSDVERQKIKEFLARYRQLPEEHKRAAPALLNGLGKLQVATGDYESAQEAFTRVAEMSADEKASAEGHYNAYRAALERAAIGEGSYPVALAELKTALRLDPARFAPFPLDDYEAKRILGAGGFGVTFLCKKKLTGADVAVKALQAEGLERDVGAVMQEASTLDQLAHPAIIRLRHCGYAGPSRTRPFIEMDYFDSVTLEEYVEKNGKLSVADVLAVARPMAQALHAAHGKGILHRDVKPANMLVRREGSKWDVRVIDFGLALKQSLLGADADTSRRNRSMTGAEIAGTRHYAAPEQMGELSGVRVGPWSDVYGWAKTCCYALFQNTEPTYLDYKKIPEPLGVLLSQCLSRLPNDRPSGFTEVLQKLDALTKKRPDAPKPRPPQAIPLGPAPPRPPEVRPPAVEVRPIHELTGRPPVLPSAIPVRPIRSQEALPAGRSSPRLAPPLPPAPGTPDAIKGPAIALLVVCVAAIVVNGIGMIGCIGAMSEGHPNDTEMTGLTVEFLLFVAFAVASAFSLLCGVLMLRRKQFILSMIGCCAAMLPIGPCCLAGLPVGIWGVTTLLRPEVRSTFT